MRKAKNPLAELERIKSEFHRSVKRWLEIRENGSNDPAWPDGMNMNLVRNHLISYKRQMRELCEDYGMFLPDECYVPLPPEVPNGLWTSLINTPRHERIQKWGDRLVYPAIDDYRYTAPQEGQMTLF